MNFGKYFGVFPKTSSRMSRRDINTKVDYELILLILILFIVGTYSVYIATEYDTSGTGYRLIGAQIAWYILGSIMALITMLFDEKNLFRLTPIIYGIGMLLLIAVLFLYSRSYATNTGGSRWFAIGSFTFQPSEIMKPAYILMMARIIKLFHDKHQEESIQNDLILIRNISLWTIPVLILLLKQHDFGTTLVFLAIFIGLTFISGISWKILVPAIISFITLCSTAIILVNTNFGRNLLEKIGFQSYQFSRVDAWLHPSADTTNSGYQVWQSIKAIGSGQLFGTGFNVSHTRVPVRESDMIFSVIGENFGFVGSILLITVYLTLIHNILHYAYNAKTDFQVYIVVGVVMMFFFHIFENIGMNIGLLPLSGIPLPLVSAGGSSIISNMVCIGLIMSIKYHDETV